jgi:N-methylhydantoinase A
MATYSLALDVGGTFTDVIMAEDGTGRLWTAKTPSTPHDPSQGFFIGVERMLALAGARPEQVGRVFHGSTVATNAILESKGATTGMLVTEGFKYVLEIGRHDIPRKANLYAWVKPKRPVPPSRIVEVPERILLDGSVEQPLDEARCREAALRLKALGVASVAVVFLHSYANPAHERRAAEILAEVFPEAPVSCSSAIMPVFREYERSMITVLNAYIQPVVGRYVSRLEAGLRERKVQAPLLIMKSNGGIYGPRQAANEAIHMALSGPAAGVIGAGLIARLSGYPNAITIDIGGTSADVSLIKGLQPEITTESEIGAFPLNLPMVDIHTIGAGGGSIASVSDQGGLLVGPRSAGASPGPACYAQGGELPTVTDANLVLGRIPPHLLGGEIALDVELARRAIHDHVAKPLKLPLERAAEGILQIVNNSMTGALRVVSLEKGHDPRDFALIAFGGAGPMHGGALARLLGVRTIVVPRYPGILCALGLLASDLQFDFVQTRLQRAPNYDLAAMEETFRSLGEEAVRQITEEGVPPERRQFLRFADLRYAKQGFELTVPFPGGAVDAATVARLVEDFHARHEQLYTFADREAAVEIVNLRVKALGLVDKLELPELGAARDGDVPAASGARPVLFQDVGFVETPVYQREGLLAGHRIVGPAVLEQDDTTTVILPGQEASVDRHANLVIRLPAA